jgi:hypothetical protein
MRVFGTEMHLVTGLLVIVEVFLLGAQLINWLYIPRVRRELLYLWLLVLMIMYNVFGGFFPDASIHWISLKLQTMLAWGSGFAVAAYIPYYFYAAFGLERLNAVLFGLALPGVFCHSISFFGRYFLFDTLGADSSCHLWTDVFLVGIPCHFRTL